MNGLKTFSEIFWPRKEKENYNPLYKDFVHVFEGIYIYIYIYIYIFMKKRFVIKKTKRN